MHAYNIGGHFYIHSTDSCLLDEKLFTVLPKVTYYYSLMHADL